jgi:hypothetical protein
LDRDAEHFEKLERLWRAVRRDFMFSVEIGAGLHPDVDGKRHRRLWNNWRKLCELDIEIAGRLAQGFTDLAQSLAYMKLEDSLYGSPMDKYHEGLDQMLGVASLGRDANPDTESRRLASYSRSAKLNSRANLQVRTWCAS